MVCALIVAAAAAAAAAEAQAKPRVRVLDTAQTTVAERGSIRVSVAGGTAKVRIPGLTTTKRVRRGKVARLRLSRAGRARLARCGDVTLRPKPRGPAATLVDAGTGCYHVGAAERSIAPAADGTFKGEKVYLGGYGIGNARPATGVLGRGPSVRAFVVSDGRRPVALVDIENQGWFAAVEDGPYGLADLRQEIAERTRGAIAAQRVWVQSDHSHGGADALGVWGGTTAAYRRFMMDRTVEAVTEALRDLAPATLRYGTAPGEDLLSNQFAYDPPNTTLDGDVRVLQAVDGDRRPLHTLLNFSAHTTVLGADNTRITGDWVQAANPLLEEAVGGTATTLVATLGRTQPADRGCPDRNLKDAAKHLCALDEYAARVVERAKQALARASDLPSGEPVTDARSYLITDAVTSPVLLGLQVGGEPAGIPINRSTRPPWQTGNVLSTVTGSARIGDILLSSIPGEAYPQIALAVSSLVPKARGYMTLGLSNDQLGYLIAPYAAYPEPIRRSFFNQRGDEVSPIDNDNYFFNVSHTMGERVICSLLRGASEVGLADATARSRHDCALFANDLSAPAGADVPGPTAP